MHQHQLPRASHVPATAGPVPSLTVPPVANTESDAFVSFLEILARRWRLAVGLFAFTLGMAFLLTALTPKQYTANVKFIAGSSGASDGSGQTSLPVLNALLVASRGQSAETYAEMLRETPAAALVVKQLGLSMTPDELLGHLTVRPVNNTAILDVGVRTRDPVASARIANALAGSFVDLRRSLIAGQADSAIAELNRQLPDAEQRMHASADRLTAFQTKTGIADAQAQTANVLAAASALDTKIAAVQVDEQQAGASLRVIEGQLSQTPKMIPNGGSTQPNPIAGQLKAQLAQVQLQLQAAQEQYTDEHPTVKALQQRERDLQNQIVKQPETVVASTNTATSPLYTQLVQQAAQLRAQQASDHSQLDVLRRQRQAAEPKIRNLPHNMQVLATLKQQAKLSEDVYNALRQKLNEAVIAKSTALSDVSVIQSARSDDVTVSPNRTINIALGVLLGIIVALTGSLLVDYLDGSVKNEREVEDRLQLPLLGTFPALGPASRPPAQWIRTVMVESVFHLVTSLRYASSAEVRTIAFTSSVQGEGKSLLALNTAIAYAELRPRVLLVDADLRLPSIHRKLEIENGIGLSDVLVGTARFDDVARPTRHGGLDVVTSGTSAPNPLRLLQSEAFASFLETAKERYNIVVLDASACASVADAAVICALTEGSVFVIASGKTDVRGARRAINKLQTAGVRNVLGAVLNNVTPRKSEIGAYGALGTDGARVFPLPPARPA